MRRSAAAALLGLVAARPAAVLEQQGRTCRAEYDRMLEHRFGVKEHVERLEASVTSSSREISQPRGSSPPARAGRLAVLIRGQAFRGAQRETFWVDRKSNALQIKQQAQAACLRSIATKLIEPYEAAGHRVDVFLTVYRELGGPLDELLRPLSPRVVSLTTIDQTSTPSQLLPVEHAVRAFMAHCASKGAAYDAVLLTRFDVHLKADIHSLLGHAPDVDGFRFLFIEAGGHWRHHSDKRVTNATFVTRGRGDYRQRNPRVPDALLALPFEYTSCFLGSVRNEFFPVRNSSKPLSFLHNMLLALNRALPQTEGGPRRYRYLLPGQFDSNPCRATCMLNPVYDLLPRMQWIVSSRICQAPSEFLYDEKTDSLCCPSPNYCCPNSASSCREPHAIKYDAAAANVSTEAIAQGWPYHQFAPFAYEMTPASYAYVADAWARAAAAIASVPPAAARAQQWSSYFPTMRLRSGRYESARMLDAARAMRSLATAPPSAGQRYPTPGKAAAHARTSAVGGSALAPSAQARGRRGAHATVGGGAAGGDRGRGEGRGRSGRGNTAADALSRARSAARGRRTRA